MRLWWLLQPGVVWLALLSQTDSSWCLASSLMQHKKALLHSSVHLGWNHLYLYILLHGWSHLWLKECSYPSYCPSLQSFPCVCSFSLCSESACFYIRYFWHLSSVHYAKALLEHEPEVAFPRTELSGCVIPVPLHTAGLGLSAARAPCVTASLHPLHGTWWHNGGPSYSTAFSLALALVRTSSSCPVLAVALMLGSTTSAAL